MVPEARVGLREAAERLGVHYMTVYRYVRTGRLRAERDNATWSVAVSDLDQMQRGGPPRAPAPTPSHPRAPRFMDRLVAGDEYGAWLIIEEALASGAVAPQIYTQLVVPAMREIGDRWERGTLSVADEHRASAVATRVIGRLGPLMARRGLSRGTVVLGAPEGDLHALPSAIVADLLRARGFDVLDLGANTPVASFVESARTASRLVAVLVGAYSSGPVAHAAEVVAGLREAGVVAPFLVGGGAVPDASAALALGADGWSGASATDVVTSVEAAVAASRGADG